jgi:CRISPR-associated protein Csb2
VAFDADSHGSGLSGRPPWRQPVRYEPLVRAWRWRVAPRIGPIPLILALPVAEAVFAALTDTCWTLSGHRRLPNCIHGPDAKKRPGWKHQHAFILPEDTDRHGFIDHISLAADMGFDPAALRLLATTDRLVLSNGQAADLIAERMGPLDHIGHAGPSRVWLSRTAYVPPNERPTGGKDAARQLTSEVKQRSLPKLVGKPTPLPNLRHGGKVLAPRLFHSETEDGQTRSQKFFFQLEFDRPVSGPLAFGWCCHRGLGQFVPLERPSSRVRSPVAGE